MDAMRSLPRTAVIMMAVTGVIGSTFATVASDVLTLTGQKAAKVAWSRYVSGDISDYQVVFGSATYRVMSYATATDQVTDVLKSTGNYYRVKINQDGSKILYNSGGDLYMVDFSGSNNHLVMKNAALDCYWYDASSGKEYVFVSRGTGGSPTNMDYWDTDDPLYRICLSDTTGKLLINLKFASGQTSTYAGIWLAVSDDGTRLGGHFPWTGGAGGGGIETLAANGTCTFASFNVYGCWGMTPPDNSYRYLLYPVDQHNQWAVFNADKSGKHTVSLLPPGITTGTYCARMSINDPHFFTLISPMDPNAAGFNTSVGIYLGKLDDGITAVQGWVKIAGAGECLGCAWIDQGTAPAQPALSLSTTQLNFSATSGGANPASQTVTVTNSGSGTLSAVTATSDTGWLTVTGGAAGNSQTLTNQVNIAGLAVGTHTATVTVKGGGAANTVTYKVTLTISLDAPKLSSIAITPSLDSIGPSMRVFFTARCKDQRGNPIAAVISWSTGSGGTLSRAASPAADSTDTSSFVSNGTLGTFLVIVASGQVKDTATVIVTSSLSYSITLLAPLGDRNFAIGDTMRVRWTASANIAAVVVHISLDNGRTWTTISGGTPLGAQVGIFSWKIPATISVLQSGGTYADVSTVSSTVLIDVRGYFNEAAGVSPKAFAITQGSSTLSWPAAEGMQCAPRIEVTGGRTITVKVGAAAQVRVYDAHGKCWAGGAIGPHAVAVMRMPGPGIYIVRISSTRGATAALVTLPQ